MSGTSFKFKARGSVKMMIISPCESILFYSEEKHEHEGGSKEKTVEASRQ